MSNEEIRNSLKQTDEQLIQAEVELYRPCEDVVTLSACQTVRTSMKQMMKLYLEAHAVDSNKIVSMEDLLEACVKTNSLFKDVDISGIECKGLGHEQCDGKYCLSVENVVSCLAAANELKTIVWSELKVNQ